jgi:Fe-Mn family superoxide dismutase
MITRRQAIKTTFLAGALALPFVRTLQAQSPAPSEAAAPAQPAGPFKLPALPYGYDALEPYIDAQTMRIHHDKHHATYVNKLNEAVATHPELGEKPIASLLENLNEVPEPIRKAVRNQGGGHYNHSLFWQWLSTSGGQPGGDLASAITKRFSSLDQFKTLFTKEALGVFGSGWAWLVLKGGELSIDSTPNQDSPISMGAIPILGLDVWEHAYYLKNQNKRADYIAAWWNVVNWDRAGALYTAKTTPAV